MKEHEKFYAFILLGGALLTLALVLYIKPLADSTQNSGVLQILNMIIGALIGGFGAAVQALFRASDQTKITNTTSEPIPTAPQEEK